MARSYFVYYRSTNPFSGDTIHANVILNLSEPLSTYNIREVQKLCDREVNNAGGPEYGNAIIVNIIDLGEDA